MCGIVGAFTSNPKIYRSPLVSFFKQALFCDTLRGVDSTGIALLDNKMLMPEIFKKAMPAPDFLQLRVVDDLVDERNAWTFMLGHNRAATRGGVNHHTAHPFQYGDITMVHNGTVNNHRTLTDGNKFGVDSEAITNAVDKEGIAAVVEHLQGAFTLVWHDAQDDSLNFVRNEERPLWVGIAEDEETLLMASEGAMLQWLASRNGIKLSKIFQPKPGQHYKYYTYGDKWALSPVVQELKLAPKPVTYGYGNGYTTGVNNFNKKKQGTSESQKKVACLRAAGVDVATQGSDEVLFKPSSFIPWTTQSSKAKTTGKIVGKLVGKEAYLHEVQMLNGDIDTWEDVKGSLVLTKVLSAYYEKTTSSKPVINVSGNPKEYTLFDTKEEYEDAKKSQSQTSSCSVGEANDQAPFDADDRSYEGYSNQMYTAQEMEFLIKDGCSMCGADLFIDDVVDKNVYWADSDSPLCTTCEEDWNAANYYGVQ